MKDGSDFAPVIVSQPERNINCNQGDDITLSIEVLNPRKGELSYQWYKNSKVIEDEPSAKTKDYKPNTDVNCTDWYECIVTNTVDGETYTATTGSISVRPALTKCIHGAEVIGQPGTYTLSNSGSTMIPGGYTAVAKNNSMPVPFNVRFKYIDYDTESTVALYHSTTNSYENAELVENAICRVKRHGGMDGGWFKDIIVTPNTAYQTGAHYFYVVITLSPEDKNSKVEPVSVKSDILRIDFTDRETTMEGAGSEQNPYIVKTADPAV